MQMQPPVMELSLWDFREKSGTRPFSGTAWFFSLPRTRLSFLRLLPNHLQVKSLPYEGTKRGIWRHLIYQYRKCQDRRVLLYD